MQREMNFGQAGFTCADIEALLNVRGASLKRPRPVRVTLTRNRSTMISVRSVGEGPVQVRMHEAFCEAPRDIFVDLRRYIRTRHRDAWLRVGAYARRMSATTGREVASVPPVRSAQGRVHDLDQIGRAVNRDYFTGRVAYTIEWGRARPRPACARKRTSLNLGAWHAARRLIRIHPLLDDPRVSEAFVRYIVFHEMLHAVVPPVRTGTRTLYHPPQFKALERTFPDYKAHRRTAREILTL